MWDDVFGEPEGVRSADCAWQCSHKCFHGTRSESDCHRRYFLSKQLLFLYRVFFYRASPEFAKCWTVSNRFQKNVRVPDWPPLMIGKSLSA